MIRGLYTGASGMRAQTHRMDALANNLANVDVNGYKRDVSAHKAFPELLIKRTSDNGVYQFPFGSTDQPPIVGKLGTGVEFNELYTVFEQGAPKETENPFDMMIEGQGFFAIQTPQGERYTRNGAFTLDENGILVTKEGYPVLGENGIIQLKKNNFRVDIAGNIFENGALADDPNRLVSMAENDWEDTQLVDTLKIVDFERVRFLKKQGNSFWVDTPESGKAFSKVMGTDTKLRQNFIEGSNVNPVTEMVRMIEVNRAYEANQKVIQTHDNLAQKLISSTGRV